MSDQATLPTPSPEPYVGVSLEPSFDNDGTACCQLVFWVFVGPFHGQVRWMPLPPEDLYDPARTAALLQDCRDFIARVQEQAAASGLRFETIDLEADLQAWREEWQDEEAPETDTEVA